MSEAGAVHDPISPAARSYQDGSQGSGAGRILTFWTGESRGGVLLALGAVVAVMWASGPWSSSYALVWEHAYQLPLLGSWAPDPRAWVDSGAMTIFFLVVGLELSRERSTGILSSWRRAGVPVVAALGGMAGAAVAYLAVVHGGVGSRGWGVPMATDVAFVAGVAGALGRRVPAALRLLLVSLAVADDIASVAVLAIVSGHRLSVWPLLMVAAVTAFLVATRQRLHAPWLALVALVPLWIGLAAGGVEPALAGVIAGVLVPVSASPGMACEGHPSPERSGPSQTRSDLESRLHPISTLVVLPLFSLANAGVDLRGPLLGVPGAVAVFAGIVVARLVGKPLGVTLGALGAARGAAVNEPAGQGSGSRRLAGGAALTGMGFTVPLLFAAVVFARRPGLFAAAQAALLAGSVGSAMLGVAVLSILHRRASGRPGGSGCSPDRPAR